MFVSPEVHHTSLFLEAFPGFSIYLWYGDSHRLSSNRANRHSWFHLRIFFSSPKTTAETSEGQGMEKGRNSDPHSAGPLDPSKLRPSTSSGLRSGSNPEPVEACPPISFLDGMGGFDSLAKSARSLKDPGPEAKKGREKRDPLWCLKPACLPKRQRRQGQAPIKNIGENRTEVNLQ